jgi:alpha-L-fucosidase
MKAIDRFYSHKWGVFNHFLAVLQNNPKSANSYGKQTDWDTLVKEFDTEHLAKTLHEIGAKYYVITVMQGTKYMIAPNSTFDKIAGTKPGEACSTRDLVEDLYTSLSKYDIDLFLYFTGDGPYQNHPEGERFGWDPNLKATKNFVEKWASVLEEYAVRYGDKVKGWWVDGCYKNAFNYTDELLSLYYKACKKGNPNALVALNNGVWNEQNEKGYEFEDFLCGERPDFTLVPKQRFYGGAQAHILAPLGVTPTANDDDEELKQLIRHMIGPGWGSFGVKRSKEFILDYIKTVNNAGGVVSIDVGVYRDGKFNEEQVEVLKYIGKNI